jgi:hypothetical protein
MDDQECSYSTNQASTPPPSAAPIDFATLAALMQQRAQAGWVWDEKTHTLAHPQDHRLHFAIDPATRQLSLSPELARQLGEIGPPPKEEQP